MQALTKGRFGKLETGLFPAPGGALGREDPEGVKGLRALTAAY
jgi:hypothetical protein